MFRVVSVPVERKPVTDADIEFFMETVDRLLEEQGVPPYIIFHDRTLAAMAQHRPESPEQLLRIGGVGEKKLERYGEAFLAEIRAAEVE